MKKYFTLLIYFISFSISISAQPSNSTIKGRVYDAKKNEPVGFAIIVIQNTTTGGNRDITNVIQSFPGVSSAASFCNDVIVRGVGPGENKFYLDRVEIPNLNHFATQGTSGGPA